MKEWYTLHSNTGGVLSLSYPLNKQFLDYGKWTIRVKCKGHIYTRDFMVEEFCKSKTLQNHMEFAIKSRLILQGLS